VEGQPVLGGDLNRSESRLLPAPSEAARQSRSSIWRFEIHQGNGRGFGAPRRATTAAWQRRGGGLFSSRPVSCREAHLIVVCSTEPS
jgi:hypothetical protein